MGLIILYNGNVILNKLPNLTANKGENIIPLIYNDLYNFIFQDNDAPSSTISIRIDIENTTVLNIAGLQLTGITSNLQLSQFIITQYIIRDILNINYIIIHSGTTVQFNRIINTNICCNAKRDIVKYIKQDNYKLGSHGSNSIRLATLVRYYSRK